MKLLVIRFASRIAIPEGGNITDGLVFLNNPELYARTMNQACAEAKAAVDLVRNAPDNPYGDEEEAIATGILEKLEARDP